MFKWTVWLKSLYEKRYYIKKNHIFSEENMYNMQEDNKPSKHQLKKERMAARKAARKNKGGTNNSMIE